LIAFLAGAELRWAELRARFKAFTTIVLVELLLTFVLLAAGMFFLTERMAFLADAGSMERLAFSIIFASIAIAHSPAATLALLSETRARGPVARTTLSLVLLSDVVVVLMFSLSAAVARAIVPPTTGEPLSVSGVAWEILGAFLVGAILGVAIAGYLRFIRRELLLFGILIAFLGAEIARLAHVEVLLTLLVAGFLTENLSKDDRGEQLREAVERAAAPVFVVFFALAGAAINLGAVAALAAFVGPLVLLRAFSIWLGVKIGARRTDASADERRYVWLGLVSQAGVAIGLASVVADQYPVRGAALQALLLATIAITQVVGPILFRRALVKSGEVAPAGSAPPRTSHVESEAEPAALP
jgi:Kef-type K+ transport system membrane component KefB